METSDADDDEPKVIRWETGSGSIALQVFRGDDGVPVVDIAVGEGVGDIRVGLNEGVIWDGDPEVDGGTYRDPMH